MTATSPFGVGKRENHDAGDFYARFTPPVVVKDEVVNRLPEAELDRIHHSDAAEGLKVLPDASVALVVTSPPYFAGKEYETAMGEGHVPASYVEYLRMLLRVFVECRRVLEPGGRIAVNVANLGRKPYRSLSADIVSILQDDLGLLLRGEIIWHKARGATGSTAWGSFQSASNPVLRDLTERVVVAGKHRFDRAIPRAEREAKGLPSTTTMNKDEFMEATLDVWEMPPESATRVNHPAPFPIELPRRLIHLYTFEGDVVLDPFMGSGTTAVAAVRAGRRFIGYDTEESYVERALQRVSDERERPADTVHAQPFTASLPVTPTPTDADEDFQSRAVREGKAAKEIAETLLVRCGFRDIKKNVKFGNGVEVNFVASDVDGERWFFYVSGAFTSTRPGLCRTDTMWKTLGKLSALAQQRAVNRERIVVLSTDLPTPGSAGDKALRSLEGTSYRAAFPMLDSDTYRKLTELAQGAGNDKARGTRPRK